MQVFVHLLIFTLWSVGTAKKIWWQILFFSSSSKLDLVFWLEFDDAFISQYPREFYGSHSQGRVQVWAETIQYLIIILLVSFKWQQVRTGLQDSSQYSGQLLFDMHVEKSCWTLRYSIRAQNCHDGIFIVATFKVSVYIIWSIQIYSTKTVIINTSIIKNIAIATNTRATYTNTTSVILTITILRLFHLLMLLQ